jgi:hypothetical protein
MITPLSTPGQWYLDFLNNGFWSALQSAGFSWWMLLIPLAILAGIIYVAATVPFPGDN